MTNIWMPLRSQSSWMSKDVPSFVFKHTDEFFPNDLEDLERKLRRNQLNGGIGAVSGSVKDPVWKYKWIEAHEKDNFARTYRWLDVKDYLLSRCTGRRIESVDEPQNVDSVGAAAVMPAGNVSVSMARTAVFYLIFTPVSAVLGNHLVETLLWNEYWVTALNMLANFVLEYLFQRFVVFGKSIDTNELAKNARAEQHKEYF